MKFLIVLDFGLAVGIDMLWWGCGGNLWNMYADTNKEDKMMLNYP